MAKQPKRKRPPKKTVEQNLSNINSVESERRCEVTRTGLHLLLMIRPPPRFNPNMKLSQLLFVLLQDVIFLCVKASMFSPSRENPCFMDDQDVIRFLRFLYGFQTSSAHRRIPCSSVWPRPSMRAAQLASSCRCSSVRTAAVSCSFHPT